jgi:hypothetical protein
MKTVNVRAVTRKVATVVIVVRGWLWSAECRP